MLYAYSFIGNKAAAAFLAALDIPFQFQLWALAFLTLSIYAKVMFLEFFNDFPDLLYFPPHSASELSYELQIQASLLIYLLLFPALAWTKLFLQICLLSWASLFFKIASRVIPHLPDTWITWSLLCWSLRYVLGCLPSSDISPEHHPWLAHLASVLFSFRNLLNYLHPAVFPFQQMSWRLKSPITLGICDLETSLRVA